MTTSHDAGLFGRPGDDGNGCPRPPILRNRSWPHLKFHRVQYNWQPSDARLDTAHLAPKPARRLATKETEPEKLERSTEMPK